jgi:hypothetical protein
MNRFSPSVLARKSILLITAASLALIVGCQERRPTDELAKAVTMGERPVAMKGTASFFNGKVVATVTISRGIGRGRKAAAAKEADEATKIKKSNSGENAFLGGGDGTGGGSSPEQVDQHRGILGSLRGGGDKNEMADISSMDNDEAMAYLRAKAAVGSPMPPVTIRLSIENTSTEAISVNIMDFNSDLGNFAVHPDVLKLAAGQKISPDPMISQLGVTSDEIPVQIRLKIGTKSDTQTVLVKNLLATSNTAQDGK